MDSYGFDAHGAPDHTVAAKESVKRTLNEIDENFKMFKHLPN